ncbi:MAG: hypothetical protein C0505_20515 [Leptothrix sp. (in: Bacteria)]|nr:hypothetical protein [Leptothrix sp. (in: b-proteobacteria)]
MNVLPIERAQRHPAAAAPAQKADPHAATAAAREQIVQRTALLARTLADVLMSNVQNTASLNLACARALLAHARIPAPNNLPLHTDTWRTTWRSFEVCATSADQMLNLTRGHVERTTAALWRGAERLLEELAQAHAARVNELLASFDALRAAQDAYWQAAQHTHEELVALAQAPALGPTTEVDHGTH